MVQVFSKLTAIPTSCIDYVHPWTDSCMDASAGLYLYCCYDSLRVYGTVYLLALLMRGRVPTVEDLKRTFSGCMQSVAFLSCTSLGYSIFLCLLRKIIGNFNILTVSSLPVFLSSVFSIFIERPSRRPLLCLYVSNIATETVWNMLKMRGLVRSIPHAPSIIFTASISLLLMFYKGGQHMNKDGKSDGIYRIIKFVVGPYEESKYLQKRTEQMTEYNRQHEQGPSSSSSSRQVDYTRTSQRYKRNTNHLYHLINQALRLYRRIVQKIKCYGRHLVCPHPFSCLYYTLHGTTKMFTTGLGIQIALKLIFNFGKIIRKPSSAKKILLRRDLFALAIFLGGFTSIFRGVSCVLRWLTGKDNQYHGLLAGLLAGCAFTQYSDNTIALYVMWKLLQIAYNLGQEAGYFPKVPGFTEFLYCLSTAILFHAAIVEPQTLRQSYYRFLHSISGGRISCMNRESFQVWGLESVKQTALTFQKLGIKPIVQYIL